MVYLVHGLARRRPAGADVFSFNPGLGSYIDGRAVEPSSPASYDADREDALWDELARLTKRPPAAPTA